MFLLLSTSLHGAAFALYQELKPTPWPRLTLHFAGKGKGVVQSSPAGISCVDDCSARFAPGTQLRLVATVAEGSTLEGWDGMCTPRADWVLECALTVEDNADVTIRFGRMPERVDLAWVTEPSNAAPEQLTITLPDPEIEAELLLEPLAELMQPEALPELAKLELPKPTEPPPEPPPAAAKLEDMPNMTSVEVPDENEVEEAPDDATHLSDKNRDVAEETHAKDTNLEAERKGEATASEESDIKSEDIGAKETEIAQLEDAEPETLDGDDGEQATDSGKSEQVVGMISGESGERGDDGDDGDDRPTTNPGVLSMREITGRGSLVPKAENPGDGGRQGKRGTSGAPGIKTELAFEDYERIVGKDKLEQERLLGRKKKQSKRMGRYERKLGAVKAALENFTPDVRPGNTTALKTRRAPFAVYIATMHRSIHELWGFGFLDDLDGKGADHPLNDWNLHTKLEIVLNPDGTIHKITIAEHSGILEFDVAAIDTILSGEPYGDTPKEIRSPDGRAYVHWGFYRNNRQCGTFNANPFILSSAPKESPGSGEAMDDSKLVRDLPGRKPKVQPGAKPAAADSSEAATSTDKRADVTAALPAPTDREAEHTANRFISAFTYNRVPKLLEITGAPFHSSQGVIANSVPEVGAIYGLVLQESGPVVRDWKLMTVGGFRKRFGELPAGMESGKPQLLMVVVTRKDRFTLELTRRPDGVFRITGLYR